jgi:LmbE family N-acetylglucosaminyl deacetylase
MLDLLPRLPTDRTPVILCIGAHCDDIEIGCGGSLLTLFNSRKDLQITWAIFSGNKQRKDEARASAESLFADELGVTLSLHDFPDGRLPYVGSTVKDAVEELKANIDPDLIFSHWDGDRHQDHRFLSELTWNTFRDNLILEYEIPKYDGDLGNPNLYISLSQRVAEQKVMHILRSFPSQQDRQWFSQDLFDSILRMRGMECRAESGRAEAFHCRKLVLNP